MEIKIIAPPNVCRYAMDKAWTIANRLMRSEDDSGSAKRIDGYMITAKRKDERVYATITPLNQS